VTPLSVKRLRTRAKLSQEDLARLVGASWASVSRWERSISRPNAKTRDRLERLAEVVRRVGDAVPPEELPDFLLTPQPLLRGYRPVELLDSKYSYEDLLAFVENAKSGDMA
jgi:transcriptional regulator with XRE-family HTH domain